LRNDTIPKQHDIVVCGYPKSGTTWLGRLVAELVDCPFQGDLGYSDGRPLEGRERISDYDCYKTHRTLPSLVSQPRAERLKLIYVVRDPRDVVISAAHHFRVGLLSVHPPFNGILAAANMRLGRVVPYGVKRNRMINAVLHGDATISGWLGIPWHEHCRPFRRSDVLIVRYEDVLADPMAKCLAVLSYLGISRSREKIAAAILGQSFAKKKAHFAALGMASEFAFLRRGGAGYWRTELGSKHKQSFVDVVGEDLADLHYPLS
jgi:sulfotransferase family protein